MKPDKDLTTENSPEPLLTDLRQTEIDEMETAIDTLTESCIWS